MLNSVETGSCHGRVLININLTGSTTLLGHLSKLR